MTIKVRNIPEFKYYRDFGDFKQKRVRAYCTGKYDLGSVLILNTGTKLKDGSYLGFVADDPLSPSCAEIVDAEVDLAYIDQSCSEIDERTARIIHPEMFRFFDAWIDAYNDADGNLVMNNSDAPQYSAYPWVA